MMNQQIHPNKIRQALYLFALLLLGGFIAKELHFLLTPTLGAVTFYVVFRKPLHRLTDRHHWKKGIASLVLILTSILLIVVPFGWLINLGYNKISPIIEEPEMIKKALDSVNKYIFDNLGFNVIDDQFLAKLNKDMMEWAKNALGETINVIGVLAMMYFILFFMFFQSKELEKWLVSNLPFRKSTVKTLLHSGNSLIFGNAIGIPIVALIQGIVGLIGYWIFGVDDFLLFGILTAIASVVPVVGTMLIYVPLALYQLAMGNEWQGIGMMIYGFVVIGSSDNVVRFILQEKLSDTHPLVTVFGVVMGVNVFGFIGVVFGPILLSIFVLLVNIYLEEYGFVKRKPDGDVAGDGLPPMM